MNYKIIFISALCFCLGACSVNRNSSEEVAPPNNKTDTGPYTVDFSNSTKTYQHNLHINISQDEGKVEYFITTAEAADIEFTSTTLKVTGCPASQVNHATFWLPDAGANSGQYITPGQKFKTQAGKKGVFIHVLKGLTSCTSVNLTTSFRQIPKATMKCKESSDSNCRVIVYCKEQDPLSSYYEVEVWDTAGYLTMTKFYNRGDGTRGIQAVNSVTSSNNGASTTYTATSGDGTYLTFNNQSLIGLYILNAMGNRYPTDVRCTLP